jgi:hypothetical protein
MRAFTTFDVKLYPIQPAEGDDEAVERVHELHFQDVDDFQKIPILRNRGVDSIAQRT